VPIVAHEAGQFTGEISQLSGHATIPSGTAGRVGALALPFDAAHLRALVIGSVDVGETIMRACARSD
jgi:thioredoxin reductase (NADPH)